MSFTIQCAKRQSFEKVTTQHGVKIESLTSLQAVYIPVYCGIWIHLKLHNETFSALRFSPARSDLKYLLNTETNSSISVIGTLTARASKFLDMSHMFNNKATCGHVGPVWRSDASIYRRIRGYFWILGSLRVHFLYFEIAILLFSVVVTNWISMSSICVKLVHTFQIIRLNINK